MARKPLDYHNAHDSWATTLPGQITNAVQLDRKGTSTPAYHAYANNMNVWWTQ